MLLFIYLFMFESTLWDESSRRDEEENVKKRVWGFKLAEKEVSRAAHEETSTKEKRGEKKDSESPAQQQKKTNGIEKDRLTGETSSRYIFYSNNNNNNNNNAKTIDTQASYCTPHRSLKFLCSSFARSSIASPLIMAPRGKLPPSTAKAASARVVRLLYGKRRNLPHTHSSAKPPVGVMLQALPHQPTHRVTGNTIAPTHSFLRGVQQAYWGRDLGRKELLQILRQHRQLRRLDRSVAVWDWCTSSEATQDTNAAMQGSSKPSPASLWCAAHDAVLLAHINDVSGTSFGEQNAIASSSSSVSSSRARRTEPLPREVYRRALAAGRSSRHLLGTVLTALNRSKDWETALRVYREHVLADGVPTDSHHLHTVMNACRKAQAWVQGIQLFQRAVGDGGRRRAPSHPQSVPRDPHSPPAADNEATGREAGERPATNALAVLPPAVPQPNAVVYLELLRLVAQSGWKKKHIMALSILEALEAQCFAGSEEPGRGEPEEEEEKEDHNDDDDDDDDAHSDPQLELTAGHYNAVLVTLKQPAWEQNRTTTPSPPTTAVSAQHGKHHRNPSHWRQRQGLALYQRMKMYKVQPSPSTLPALLATGPTHIPFMLACIDECHANALPVTSDMYNFFLRAVVRQKREDRWADTLDEPPKERAGAAGPAHRARRHTDEVAPGGGGSFTTALEAPALLASLTPDQLRAAARRFDLVAFIEREYIRYESFHVAPDNNPPAVEAPARQGRAAPPRSSGPFSRKAPDEDDEDEAAKERSEGRSAPHPTPQSSFPDLIGLHLTTALVDVLLAHPDPMEAQALLHRFAPRLRLLVSPLSAGTSDRLGLEPADIAAARLAGGAVGPPPSAFLLQVHGRVAVVEHNVLLSPLFDSLSYHYDTILIPFSAVRVLVRRLGEFRPNTQQGRRIRRALERLRQRLSQQQQQQLDPSGPIIRVITLAHQLYAHRYLTPMLHPAHGHGEGKEDSTLLEGQSSASVPGLTSTSTASTSFAQRLLAALQDTDEDPKKMPNAVASALPASPPPSASSEILSVMSAKQDVSVAAASPLVSAPGGMSAPARVLAVAAMVKTFNPEASVHVLDGGRPRGGKRKPWHQHRCSAAEDGAVRASGTQKEKSTLQDVVACWNQLHLPKQRQQKQGVEMEEAGPLVWELVTSPHYLQYVRYPEELATKAPSELQLPGGEGGSPTYKAGGPTTGGGARLDVVMQRIHPRISDLSTPYFLFGQYGAVVRSSRAAKTVRAEGCLFLHSLVVLRCFINIIIIIIIIIKGKKSYLSYIFFSVSSPHSGRRLLAASFVGNRERKTNSGQQKKTKDTAVLLDPTFFTTVRLFSTPHTIPGEHPSRKAMPAMKLKNLRQRRSLKPSPSSAATEDGGNGKGPTMVRTFSDGPQTEGGESTSPPASITSSPGAHTTNSNSPQGPSPARSRRQSSERPAAQTLPSGKEALEATEEDAVEVLPAGHAGQGQGDLLYITSTHSMPVNPHPAQPFQRRMSSTNPQFHQQQPVSGRYPWNLSLSSSTSSTSSPTMMSAATSTLANPPNPAGSQSAATSGSGFVPNSPGSSVPQPPPRPPPHGTGTNSPPPQQQQSQQRRLLHQRQQRRATVQPQDSARSGIETPTSSTSARGKGRKSIVAAGEGEIERPAGGTWRGAGPGGRRKLQGEAPHQLMQLLSGSSSVSQVSLSENTMGASASSRRKGGKELMPSSMPTPTATPTVAGGSGVPHPHKERPETAAPSELLDADAPAGPEADGPSPAELQAAEEAKKREEQRLKRRQEVLRRENLKKQLLLQQQIQQLERKCLDDDSRSSLLTTSNNSIGSAEPSAASPSAGASTSPQRQKGGVHKLGSKGGGGKGTKTGNSTSANNSAGGNETTSSSERGQTKSPASNRHRPNRSATLEQPPLATLETSYSPEELQATAGLLRWCERYLLHQYSHAGSVRSSGSHLPQSGTRNGNTPEKDCVAPLWHNSSHNTNTDAGEESGGDVQLPPILPRSNSGLQSHNNTMLELRQRRASRVALHFPQPPEEGESNNNNNNCHDGASEKNAPQEAEQTNPMHDPHSLAPHSGHRLHHVHSSSSSPSSPTDATSCWLSDNPQSRHHPNSGRHESSLQPLSSVENTTSPTLSPTKRHFILRSPSATFKSDQSLPSAKDEMAVSTVDQPMLSSEALEELEAHLLAGADVNFQPTATPQSPSCASFRIPHNEKEAARGQQSPPAESTKGKQTATPDLSPSRVGDASPLSRSPSQLVTDLPTTGTILHFMAQRAAVEALEVVFNTLERPIDFLYRGPEHPAPLHFAVCEYGFLADEVAEHIFKLFIFRLCDHPGKDLIDWTQKVADCDFIAWAATYQRLSLFWPHLVKLPLFKFNVGETPIPIGAKIWQWDWDRLDREQRRFALVDDIIRTNKSTGQLIKRGQNADWKIRTTTVEECVKSGADVCFRSPYMERCILHEFIVRSDIDCVRICLSSPNNLDFNQTEDHETGNTLIHTLAADHSIRIPFAGEILRLMPIKLTRPVSKPDWARMSEMHRVQFQPKSWLQAGAEHQQQHRWASESPLIPVAKRDDAGHAPWRDGSFPSLPFMRSIMVSLLFFGWFGNEGGRASSLCALLLYLNTYGLCYYSSSAQLW
eukprot:gene12759-8698_t